MEDRPGPESNSQSKVVIKEKMKGQVRNLLETYGFIREIPSGKSYFFHQNETKNFGKLMVNDEVKFELGEGKKGADDVVAVQVERIEETPGEEAGEETKDIEKLI